MSEQSNKMWVPCTIENTGFSSERRFEVNLGEHGLAVGTAFIEYLQDSQKRPLQDGEPPYGDSAAGFVQCRIIKKNGDSYVIEFPSADIFHVPAAALNELRRTP